MCFEKNGSWATSEIGSRKEWTVHSVSCYQEEWDTAIFTCTKEWNFRKTLSTQPSLWRVAGRALWLAVPPNRRGDWGYAGKTTGARGVPSTCDYQPSQWNANWTLQEPQATWSPLTNQFLSYLQLTLGILLLQTELCPLKVHMLKP